MVYNGINMVYKWCMKKSVTLSIRIPEDIYKILKKSAESHHCSMNTAIVISVEKWLVNQGLIKTK